MDEEDEHLSSEFYYPEDLETSGVESETGVSESQKAIDDFYTNKQKSAYTIKKTATDMNSPLRYMEANGVTKERIESLPASELDQLLSRFFPNTRRKKWRRVRASNNFQFPVHYKAKLKDVGAQNVPTYRFFFTLATQKGKKKGGSPISFCRRHAWKNTLNLKKSGFVSE